MEPFYDNFAEHIAVVGEEGTEVVIAALAQENAQLAEEIADLTYHVLVLMAAKGLTPADVLAELERRHK